MLNSFQHLKDRPRDKFGVTAYERAHPCLNGRERPAKGTTCRAPTITFFGIHREKQSFDWKLIGSVCFLSYYLVLICSLLSTS